VCRGPGEEHQTELTHLNLVAHRGRAEDDRFPARSTTGAAAVVVMGKAKAVELGLDWLAEIGAHRVVAGPDTTLQQQPANAIAATCAQEGLDPASLDLIEINEAFAAVGIASTRTLDLDSSTVNVNGGAIAIGHPIGMSGPGSPCTSRWN
jgi:acetyl-CoA acetyltransferase